MNNLFRILAIDYGKKRVGIAVTDPMRIIVQPKEHIINNDKEQLVNQIYSYINTENVGKIVLGCPEKNNQNAALVDEIIEFSKSLSELSKKEIVIVDESFTSVKAVDKMIESGRKKKFRSQKGNVDSFAAAIILEEYLQNENN